MNKTLKIILSAVLFGLLAGGVMLGVVKLADSLSDKEEAAVEETEEEREEKEEKKQPVREFKTEEDRTTISQGEKIQGGVTMMDVSGVVEECMPEVVAITNTTVIKQQGYNSFYDYFYGKGTEREYTTQASGSGVIYEETEEELLIVTNKHVVEGATELEVTFIDGSTAKADLKGTGGDIDIAVIAIPLGNIDAETKKEIKVAKLHEEEDLKPGQGVIAIGNALGYGQSVTVGVISAVNRTLQVSQTEVYEDLIQTDAAINPGNSGGALLNNEGELIGINVAKLATTEVEGVGFAIPIYKVADLIAELSTSKTKVEIDEENQGRLGIYMNTISSDQAAALNMPAGVIIMGFSDEEIEGVTSEKEYSPAREAGLQKNDVITKFDGQSVADAQELANLVKYYEAGTDVTVTVQRINNGEYEEREFIVTLGKKTQTEETEAEEDTDRKDQERTDGREEEREEKDSGDNRENSSENGSAGEYGGDMYEFFRKYLEQYQ